MRFVGEQYNNPNKDKHIIINILCNDWLSLSGEGKALECIPLGYAFRLILSPYALHELLKRALREKILDIKMFNPIILDSRKEAPQYAKDKERRVKA